MRTIQFIPEEAKRIAKSMETLNVYAPLAESLGMWIVKTELENLSLKHANPEIFTKYSEMFKEDPRTKDPFRSHMKSYLENLLTISNIEGYVAVRENSLVRLKDKKLPFSYIDDVVSFRIVISGGDAEEKRRNCGIILMKAWEAFKDQEDPSRFDNFYDSPRTNGYSALQMTLNTPEGSTQVAITSDEKEDYNNWGVVSLIRKGEGDLSKHALKLVVTPTGQVKFLDLMATGLDLAYLIDPKMGAEAAGMLVNGVERPIATVIPNGADVEILLGPERTAPNRGDVDLSQKSTKKTAEKQFVEARMQEEEEKGREKVMKIISKRGLLDLNDLTHLKEHSGKLSNFLNYSGSKKSLPTLYRLVKYGVISEEDLNEQLDAQGISKTGLGLTSIQIEGRDAPRLMGFFGGEISKFGGNIRYNEGRSNNEGFSQRLVVEKLSKEAEEALSEIFKANPNIDRVTIV